MTHNWETFSAKVIRGRRSLIRASIEALEFLYVGIEPSLLNWRASTLKCRLSRTPKGTWATEKEKHDKKVYRSKKLLSPAISECVRFIPVACSLYITEDEWMRVSIDSSILQRGPADLREKYLAACATCSPRFLQPSWNSSSPNLCSVLIWTPWPRVLSGAWHSASQVRSDIIRRTARYLWVFWTCFS